MFEAIAILIAAWIGYNVIRSLIFRSKSGETAGGDGGGDSGGGTGSSNNWTGDTCYDDSDSGGCSDGGGGGDSGGD